MLIRPSVFALAILTSGIALAQEPPAAPAPGVVARGSSDVQVGGMPAARGGDATTAGNGAPVVEGSPNVFINGKPAARVGDRTGCGVVVQGSSTVFVNGRPLARAGDATSGC